MQQRLNNLGFACGRADGELDDRTIAALNLFRLRVGLPVSGEIDDATLNRLSAFRDLMQPLPREPIDDSDDEMTNVGPEDDAEFDPSEEIL
jgi:peptidoglycan hydrolase-like protein with peptidoglycan-binding domain